MEEYNSNVADQHNYQRLRLLQLWGKFNCRESIIGHCPKVKQNSLIEVIPVKIKDMKILCREQWCVWDYSWNEILHDELSWP